MTGKAGTLLMSPHSDDIAFSIGGSVTTGFFPGPLVMVTVFTRSISADYFEGPHDVETITAVRGSEDREYAKRIGSETLRLGLPEATYFRKTGRDIVPLNFFAYLLWGWGAIPPHPAPRGSLHRFVRRLAAPVSVVERSVLLHSMARRDRTHAILRSQFFSILEKHPGAMLVSPLGLGTHPNHVSVAEACRSLKSHSSHLIFYEDLSYACAYTPAEVLRFVRIFDKELRPTLVPIDDAIGKKVENGLLYASQVRRGDMDKLVNYAEAVLPRGAWERVWTYPEK